MVSMWCGDSGGPNHDQGMKRALRHREDLDRRRRRRHGSSSPESSAVAVSSSPSREKEVYDVSDAAEVSAMFAAKEENQEGSVGDGQSQGVVLGPQQFQ